MFAFNSITEFLGMHGYAQYVWPVWGGIMLILVVHVLYGYQERRALVASIRRERRRQKAHQRHTRSSHQVNS